AGLLTEPDGGHAPCAVASKNLAHDHTSVKWPSRSSRRSILPDAVLGISATNTKRRGHLKFAGPVGGARRSRAGPRASRDQEHLALVLAIQHALHGGTRVLERKRAVDDRPEPSLDHVVEHRLELDDRAQVRPEDP